MTERVRAHGSSPYEAKFGFCRALKVGNVVHVAGTAPVTDSGEPFQGDAAAQTRRCFEICGQALAELGASLDDVVRTRMYLTDINDWPEVGAVHGELFGQVQPVATMVAVAALIDPAWRVEVEVEAVIPND